jgi:Mlc titration factor MtfA (ptsG expression regulator)
MNLTLFVIAAILLLLFIWTYLKGRKSKSIIHVREDSAKEILEEHVRFYQKLDPAGKATFVERVEDFIGTTAINGVGVDVTDMDKVLVAAGAIIPIFSFPGWKYRNVHEVLIYKETFNEKFSQVDDERNILGMVGEGAMNNTMIISQQALRDGFNRNDGHNTAIHEFVHLLDKADGSTDGIPEYLLDNQHALPWLKRIKEEMKHIRNRDGSDADINPYAGTNEAEFFAVISEYFFEKPQQLKEKHPLLYRDLENIFQ